MTKLIITISREYGSGGRQIGKKLAEKLKIPFYDKSVNEFTALKSGFPQYTIDSVEEKAPSIFTYGMYSYTNMPPIHDDIFLAQSEVIKTLADKGPCVIVGRCADYVLEGRKNVINIFVHAPLENRIKKVVGLYKILEIEAKKAIIKNDRARKKYHDHYAERQWGKAQNYHMTINSAIGFDFVVDSIINLVNNIDSTL